MAEVVIVSDRAAAGALAAGSIAELIRNRPDAVLGLATGSTPLPLYEALRDELANVDVSQVRGFALDEYVGIDRNHPESYVSVINREVIEPLGLDPQRIQTPPAYDEDLAGAGARYEEAIREAGGIDV